VNNVSFAVVRRRRLRCRYRQRPITEVLRNILFWFWISGRFSLPHLGVQTEQKPVRGNQIPLNPVVVDCTVKRMIFKTVVINFRPIAGLNWVDISYSWNWNVTGIACTTDPTMPTWTATTPASGSRGGPPGGLSGAAGPKASAQLARTDTSFKA
jgi:hypothetical protein